MHDEDVLVPVLNKTYVQTNALSAFQKRNNVCDAFFDEWGLTFENETPPNEAMQYGSANEINVVATMVGKIMPVLFPDLTFL